MPPISLNLSGKNEGTVCIEFYFAFHTSNFLTGMPIDTLTGTGAVYIYKGKLAQNFQFLDSHVFERLLDRKMAWVALLLVSLLSFVSAGTGSPLPSCKLALHLGYWVVCLVKLLITASYSLCYCYECSKLLIWMRLYHYTRRMPNCSASSWCVC